jgi:Kef-type K+ transport system membrane component KefB
MSELGQMLLNLFVLYAAARLAGALFLRLRQPAVVGEILVGLLIGPHALGLLQHSPAIDSFHALFAELGVVFLLFIVGLETDPVSLWRVGRQASLVGTLGVILPFALGYALMQVTGRFSLGESLFVATALTATSVGITARVLADLRALGTVVANVILGAAVFDDILGMLVLAVVSGLTLGALSGSNLALLLAETVAFVLLAVFLGRPAVHRMAPRIAARGLGQDPVFALAVTLCFAFSALAELIGLAAIIGAFFAGIIFAETKEAAPLRRAMQPIYQLLVPIFFVLMGAQVDLHALSTGSLLALGLVVTLLAILGKVIGCGAAALSLGWRNALAIGVGMVPRGEVGIVVASIGLSRGVIGPGIYSIVILMCVLTSLLGPPLLRQALLRGREVPPEAPGDEGRP